MRQTIPANYLHNSGPITHSDRPVFSKKQDAFNRAGFAIQIARLLERRSENGSTVYAVQGPWGSGKSSLVNFAIEELETKEPDNRVFIFQFNPWFFSTQEELLSRFFAELSIHLGSQRGRKLQKAGKALAKYGAAISPLAHMAGLLLPGAGGKAIEAGPALAKAAGTALAAGATTPAADVRAQRKSLQKRLRDTETTFLVVIDDIDRLDSYELREVFRLVRLVGDFDGVSYLLVFDREKVVQKLEPNRPLEAEEYLEKIIQVAIDVPELDRLDFAKHLEANLNRLISDVPQQSLEADRWSRYFWRAFLPLFRTPRDVKRFSNTVPMLLSIEEDVALVDILGLEALRVLCPAAHREILRWGPRITLDDGNASEAWNDALRRRKQDEVREAVTAILGASGDHKEAVREALFQLFPRSQMAERDLRFDAGNLAEWRRDRRVAHSEVFSIYAQRGLPGSALPQRVINLVLDGNLEDAEASVSKLSPDQVVALFERLTFYDGRVNELQAERIASTAMRNVHRLPDERLGLFANSKQVGLGRVLLRAVRSVSEERRTDLVRRLCSTDPSCSPTVELLDVVGHRADIGHALIPPESWKQLERNFADRIMGLEPAALAKEPWLWQVMELVQRARGLDSAEAVAWAISSAEDDRVFHRLLGSLVTEIRSGRLDGSEFHVEHDLAWGVLLRVLPEAFVRARLVAFQSTPEGKDSTPVRLASEYASVTARAC